MGKWLDMLRAETDHETANPPPPENRETDSRVISMTPATSNPISEAAIMEAMRRATRGLPITAEQFRDYIDDDEAQWCATGRIPPKTARAYARLLAARLSHGGAGNDNQ